LGKVNEFSYVRKDFGVSGSRRGGCVVWAKARVVYSSTARAEVVWGTLGSCSCFVLWRLVIDQECMTTIEIYNWNVLSVKYSFTAIIKGISLISEFVG
jgi:hypothetical protein